MNLRTASSVDLDSLKALKNGSLSTKTIQRRISETAAGKASYLVAEDEGKIVGHVFLKFYGKPTAPDYPDIEDLYVDANHRQRGIASALLKACEETATAKGFTRIGLAVTVDEDDPARQLYPKLGYEPTDVEPYVDGVYNGVEDWVINMKKELHQEI